VLAILELGEPTTSSTFFVRDDCQARSHRAAFASDTSWHSELEVKVRSCGEEGGLAVVSDSIASHTQGLMLLCLIAWHSAVMPSLV